MVTVLALGFGPMASAGEATSPSFDKEVAPILFKNCARCHRSGEIAAAVPLVSYETARPWAKSIKEKVLSHEMPPWGADPNASVKFRNDARLSQRDINMLVAWVNAGAPKGQDADLPPLPEFPQGWLHPKGLAPDVILSPAEDIQIPAQGEIPYIRYLVKVPFAEDKWVTAAQVRPGNRAVVHHMAITELKLDDGVTPADLDEMARLSRLLGVPNQLTKSRPAVTAPDNPAVFDMLGMYVPGATIEMYGEDNAKLLKGGKNQYLNFNVHYTATGKPEQDRSTIGLWFQAGPPKHQRFRVPGAAGTILVEGHELLTDAPGRRAEGTSVAIPPIPPYADNYEVIGISAYTEPVTIYAFQPHAHLRGKDFKYTVLYPDGREATLLTVPKYDFNWQLAYELETPLRLPAGSALIATAHYDNSAKNKFNPGPEKQVYFRDENQSWDEMFTPFVEYSFDNQDLTRPAEPRDANAVDIAEVVGCLEQGPGGKWTLAGASDSVRSRTQATSSAALKNAAAKPLGNRRYRLLDAGLFNASSHTGQKVAVKGALIQDAKESRLNVTSLQTVAPACSF